MKQLVHGGDWMGYRERFGRDALDFSANVSPLGLPEGVAQAIRDALPLADRYPDPLCRTLRAALSRAEGVPQEHILCGNGAADLIFRLVWAKKPRRVEEKTVFLLVRDGKIALRKRPKTGLLAGLWEFPNVEGTLDETAAGAAVEAMGLSVIDWQSRLTAKHIFTHVEWHMTGYALTVRGDGPAELEWVDAAGLAARSVPSAFARYYEEAKRELEMK